MRKVAIFLVLLFALLASRWLLKPGYFTMHDDLQMMRQLQLEKCFKDGQIPCRWVPDMGFGYGYPLFNFYPPLPYYFGQLFRLIGFTFADTAKAIFILQFFLSGITMFILASDLWGVGGGVISAVFYVWAPYHSVDVFVRGAMNEAWAFIWFPLILWSVKKLLDEEKVKYVVWLALSTFALLLTHNVMVMAIIPIAAVWLIYWMIVYKKFFWQRWQLLLKFLGAGIWALGLAAYYTLPLFIEKKYTHIETMFSGYFDWRGHFTSFNQLFISRFWGWGSSLWQQADGMPFPVGQVHWIVGLLLFLVALHYLLRSKLRVNPSVDGEKLEIKFKTQNCLVILLFLTGLGYTFLTHQRAVFVWKLIPPLQLAQFPWRFLIGSAFSFSLMAGAVHYLLRRKLVSALLIVLVVVWNWNFFRPASMGPMTDSEKFSGKAWEFQQTAGIYDYLPITSPKAPISPPKNGWSFIDGAEGEGEIIKGTNWFQWNGEVRKEGKIMISSFYFPGWKAWLNGKEVGIATEPEIGRMIIDIPTGKQSLYLRFVNTPIRSWSNFISLLSWLLMAVFIGRKRFGVKNV